jgi:tight adherence protein C
MAAIVSLAFFVLVACAITYFGHLYYARPGRIYEHLGEASLPAMDKTGDDFLGLPVRVLQTIGEVMPPSAEDVSVVRRDLIASGYRSDTAVTVFFGIRILACVGCAVAGLILRNYLTSNFILGIAIVVAAAFAGFFGPSMVLEQMAASRQERLRLALPDALDLLVVCVEAGLGLDQAIQVVARELALTHRELCEEFALVNLEIRAGKRRIEALKGLAERTGETEIRKLIAMLVQTDRFGTSIAESLRTHSEFMRVRRRQEAEERAGKVGVKLVFPIFFCILPAMLLVTAGPGMLQVFKYLVPMMKNFSVT